MTPALLATVSIPMFIAGLAVVGVNFKMAAKSMGDFDTRIIVHLFGGVLIGTGSLGSVIALIWYIVLNIIAK